jgi:hypothetical protein
MEDIRGKNMTPDEIVKEIKIVVPIMKIGDGQPINAEVSMNEKSQKYIADLIRAWGHKRYEDGIKDGKTIAVHGMVNWQE